MKPIHIILPVLAAVASASPALAAPGIASLAANGTTHADSAIISSVSESDLRDLVLAVGDTIDAVHPLDDPSVRGKDADGLKYLLVSADCPADSQVGCESIMMQVRYTDDDKVTLKGINSANYTEAAVGTWWNHEGAVVGFTRFVYLKGGVTWGNLKANLKVLIDAQYTASTSVWPDD